MFTGVRMRESARRAAGRRATAVRQKPARTARNRSRLRNLLMFITAGVSAVSADDVEKVLFLVVEDSEIVASNALTGRIDRLELHAKERVVEYEVANAVAVVITNQRYAAYSVPYGAWQSLGVRAQEEVESVQAVDYSATVVTTDRILNFSGRRGSWTEARRALD